MHISIHHEYYIPQIIIILTYTSAGVTAAFLFYPIYYLTSFITGFQSFLDIHNEEPFLFVTRAASTEEKHRTLQQRDCFLSI